MKINKNTYSLFILKPGFVDFEKELETVLNKNNIAITARERGVLPVDKIKVHYAEHEGKHFYNKLVNYMTKGEIEGIYRFDPTTVKMVVASTLENETEDEFIARTRNLVRNVLRPRMAIDRNYFSFLSDEDFKEVTITANGVHASDSGVSAKREVNNLFPKYFENEQCK